MNIWGKPAATDKKTIGRWFNFETCKGTGGDDLEAQYPDMDWPKIKAVLGLSRVDEVEEIDYTDFDTEKISRSVRWANAELAGVKIGSIADVVLSAADVIQRHEKMILQLSVFIEEIERIARAAKETLAGEKHD